MASKLDLEKFALVDNGVLLTYPKGFLYIGALVHAYYLEDGLISIETIINLVSPSPEEGKSIWDTKSCQYKTNFINYFAKLVDFSKSKDIALDEFNKFKWTLEPVLAIDVQTSKLVPFPKNKSIVFKIVADDGKMIGYIEFNPVKNMIGAYIFM